MSVPVNAIIVNQSQASGFPMTIQVFNYPHILIEIASKIDSPLQSGRTSNNIVRNASFQSNPTGIYIRRKPLNQFLSWELFFFLPAKL